MPGTGSRTPRDDQVACVILNFNGIGDTLPCIDSVRKLEGGPPHIIVVDNGSSDGSAEALDGLSPPITLIRSPENLGFGGGANLGIRRALALGVDYVWLLNNDTLVESSLDPMVAILEDDPKVGGVASTIFQMQEDSVEAYGGGSVNHWLGTTQPYTEPTERPLDYLACASAVIRSSVFEQVGLFDTVFFAYYEDIDLSLRMTSQGWTLATTSESKVRHKRGATTNRGQTTRSLWGDLVYVESAGAFLGKNLDARKVVGTPLRLIAMIVVRIGRRQWRRIPTVIARFLKGFRRGLLAKRQISELS